MAVAFSTKDQDTYVDVEEVIGTGHVTMTFESPDDTLTVTVEAGDLARALITASPTFAKGVSELTQRAILEFLGESEAGVGK
jgi:hypothetical protein